MKRLLYLITFTLVFGGQPLFAQIQGNNPINLNDPDDISYLDPKNYIIGGVRVSGTEYLDNDVLITISKLVVGQYIEIPSEETANVIKTLMAQNLFDYVQLYAERFEGENVYLEIRVRERPRLTRIEIDGLKKGETEEVQKRLNTSSGRIVNENLLKTTRSTIQKFIREKSFLYPKIEISTKKDSAETNNEIFFVNVTKNKKIKVHRVYFDGNEEFSDRQLRKYLKGVKPRRWYRIFGPGKFKDDKYKEAKENLIAKMQDKGYRDAQILVDSISRYDNNEVDVHINLHEGPRYYMGDIQWSGNSKYT